MTRVSWQDVPSTATPLSAAFLNDLEARKPENDELLVNVKAPPFNAQGDGVSDDTAAFVAARDTITSAAEAVGSDVVNGAGLYVPPGVYLIGDFDLSNSAQQIVGAGLATTLKAKSGATYVLKIEGKRQCSVENLMIHGNNKASKGIKLSGSGSISSEQHTLQRVRLTQCSTGVDVVSGTPDQVDKNTYYACHWIDCDKGMVINSLNAQQQMLIGCAFDACVTYGVELTNGSLEMLGGQFQSGGATNIKINGATVQWVDLTGVITENSTAGAIVIDGSTHWPLNHVTLRHCVIETPAGGFTVKMGVATPPSVLYAEQCRFVNGDLQASATDAIFHDVYCTFLGGATVTGGTQFRRPRWWQDGLDLSGQIVTIQPPVASLVGLKVTGATGQTGNLIETRDSIGNQMTSIQKDGYLQVWPVAGVTNGLQVLDSSGNAKFRVATADGQLTLDGDLIANIAGKGLKVKEGSNAKMGTATLVAGTVVVSTTAVSATSRILLTGQNSSGTHGELTISARTAGTSFTITSANGADTRAVAWMIVEPA